MGLMELPPVEPGRLIVTPHPMLLDGQRNVVWEARAGESLYAILQRNVPELDGQPWEVCIGGRAVERHLWHHTYPKQGQVIEVRGGVGRAALMVVAMIALTYFTMGAGAGWIAGAFGVTAGGFAAAAIGAGLFMAGSMLINKVLGPKQPKARSNDQDSVYAISGARNQLRPYEPFPLLFGRVRITPDLLSKPYTWYEGNDQYLGILLSAGINVGRIEQLYNGDTPLSNYEGVQVTHAGYTEMPDQSIPLFSNVDTIDGAELPNDSTWVQRTTSADTVRIQINLEYILGGQGTSGKNYYVNETVESQYRVLGATNWMPLVTRTFRSEKFDVRRATLAMDVERGQYEVRVRMLGQGNYSGKNTQKNDFQWTQLSSVQTDDADYTGIARSGVRIKATGQLNGSPDELRGVAYARPIPEWNGTAYVTKESSNPGAQCVAYARGIAEGGRLLAGMALSDEQIDLASWKAFTLHCAANGYTYDHYIKDARSHADVLSSIARAGFGEITWAGGRLGVVWAAQEQPLSGVVNMATIKKGQFQVDYNLVNAADGIEYTYIDAATWETKTLRVPAPGVVTMLNPAQVAGEGVGTEQHAARMARWHLAQSLYQYKEISYSADIEHLSYQRLSLLAMQHDMTQWGYGGRVQAAVNATGAVTLTLDEAVPARTGIDAYIGLRIPGERVYRVLRVKQFVGESRTVELAEAWPSDAALPGNADSNPAHDTLWIYDFKQTPGYRVRVTSIEPENDLKGAAIRCVPEGPEFWEYVLNGHYIPAPNQSLLQTRPVASNLRISEQQVVQGNTTFTELTATFDITGPVGNILVLAAGQDQELLEVAQTQTRTATWRIPRADAYTIVVRPFGPDGETGIAASATYITAGADVPPALIDLFNVQERSGGVRLYTWGWLADTMQSPDFAGVEIRYTEGDVPAPEWDAMTPVGDTGYHTVPFEAVVPQSGTWTFACRSRNTAGQLSIGMRVIARSLGANLGQQLGGIAEDLDAITQQQVVQQAAIDKEIADRIAADLNVATQAGADATAKANAARDEAIARVDALAAEIGEIVNAPEWSPTDEYIVGWLVREDGSLYRAKVANTNVRPSTDPATWEYIGQFASVAEVAAAALQLATVTANELGAEAIRIDSLQVRMPAGNGLLETKARVDQVDQARVSGDEALAQSINTVSTKADNAQSSATSAQTAANNAASVASSAQTAANGAQSTATNALNVANGAASAITMVEQRAQPNANLVSNSQFQLGASSVTLRQNPGNQTHSAVGVNLSPDFTLRGESTWYVREAGRGSGSSFPFSEFYVGEPIEVDYSSGVARYEASLYLIPRRCEASCLLIFQDYLGQDLAIHESSRVTASGSLANELFNYTRTSSLFRTVPSGAVRVRVAVRKYNTNAGVDPNDSYVFMARPLASKVPVEQTQQTVWSPAAAGLARVTQELKVGVDEVSGRLAAKVTNVLDVNGYISGTVSENDGRRSSYAILADVFRIISGGLTGFEVQSGYQRNYSSGAQLITGHNFGSGDLVFWYGPNIGAAACSKANATIWFDKAGNAYFGGSLSAGVRKNGMQSTQISGTASVETGKFGTAGNPKVVTSSLSYDNNFSTATNLGTSDVTLSATIVMERAIGNGAWQELGRVSVSGIRTYIGFEPGLGYSYSYTIGGSFNRTDNSTSLEDFNYRTRIEGAVGWPEIRPEGGPNAFGRQSTTILSVEQ
jgi:hypothetical protein